MARCRTGAKRFSEWRLPEGLKGLDALTFMDKTFWNAVRMHVGLGLDVPDVVMRWILYDVLEEFVKRPDGSYRRQDLELVKEIQKFRSAYGEWVSKQYGDYLARWKSYKESVEFARFAEKIRGIPDGRVRAKCAVDFALAYMYQNYQLSPGEFKAKYGSLENSLPWLLAEKFQRGWCAVFSRKWVFWIAFALTIDHARFAAAVTGDWDATKGERPWYARPWTDPAIRPVAWAYEEVVVPLVAELGSTLAAEAARKGVFLALALMARVAARLALYHPALRPVGLAAKAAQLAAIIGADSPFAFFGWQIGFEWVTDGVIQHGLRYLLHDIYLKFKLSTWNKSESVQTFGSAPDRVLRRAWQALKDRYEKGWIGDLGEQFEGWYEQLSEGLKWAVDCAKLILESLLDFQGSLNRQTPLVPGWAEPYVKGLWDIMSYHGRVLMARHVWGSKGAREFWDAVRQKSVARDVAGYLAQKMFGESKGLKVKDMVMKTFNPEEMLVRLCENKAIMTLEDFLMLEFWDGMTYGGPSWAYYAKSDLRGKGIVAGGFGPKGPWIPGEETPEDAGLPSPNEVSPGETSSVSSPWWLWEVRFRFWSDPNGEPDIDETYQGVDIPACERQFLEQWGYLVDSPLWQFRVFELFFKDPRVLGSRSTHGTVWVPCVPPGSVALAVSLFRPLRTRHRSGFSSAIRSLPLRRIGINYPEWTEGFPKWRVDCRAVWREGFITHYVFTGYYPRLDKEIGLGYVNVSNARILSSSVWCEGVAEYTDGIRWKLNGAFEVRDVRVKGRSNLGRVGVPLTMWEHEVERWDSYSGEWDDPAAGVDVREFVRRQFVLSDFFLDFFASEGGVVRVPSHRSKVVRTA